jgi:hypothetical protein
MGRMKELMINEMNRHIDMTSDLDWDYKQNNNQLAPPPNEINTESNLCMWEIKSIKDDCIYKIWANSYKEALEILPRIEDL